MPFLFPVLISHQTPLLLLCYGHGICSVPSVRQGTAVLEGWWYLQSGHSGSFCCPFFALPWALSLREYLLCSCTSDLSAFLLLPSDSLFLSLRGSLVLSRLFPPPLWSFLSFLKYIFTEATMTSVMGSVLACNGSRAIWNWLSSTGQSLTFFHRGHPCKSPLPKKNLATPTQQLLSTLLFQIENPYAIITI